MDGFRFTINWWFSHYIISFAHPSGTPLPLHQILVIHIINEGNLILSQTDNLHISSRDSVLLFANAHVNDLPLVKSTFRIHPHCWTWWCFHMHRALGIPLIPQNECGCHSRTIDNSLSPRPETLHKQYKHQEDGRALGILSALRTVLIRRVVIRSIISS